MGWSWHLTASTDSEVEVPYGSMMLPEDTMNLKIVEAVDIVVTGEPGHLDQYPYIDSWLGWAQDPPTWTKFCIQKGKGKILTAQKLIDDKKGNSTGFGRGDLTPPPCWIMTCLPPSAPPGPEVALMPDPGPGEVPAAATALPQALPELVEPPETQQWRPLVNASRIPPQLDLLDCIHISRWVLMGRGKKTQQLARGYALPRNRGKNPTTDCREPR